jgi:hypothetical protein
LARWILAAAPGVPMARPGRYVLPIQKVTPPSVPFAVSLHRWPRDGFPFPFVIRHIVEGDVEARRLSRMSEAYGRKHPKLLQWKKTGARTILILEEDDIFLTNHFSVADALFQIEGAAADRPDETYLLSVLSSLWFITRLRVGDRTLYDIPVDERFWETHPDSLVNVTGQRTTPARIVLP